MSIVDLLMGGGSGAILAGVAMQNVTVGVVGILMLVLAVLLAELTEL